MELWVRSQDKDYLIKVKSLLVEKNDNYNTWQIFGDSRYLGTYKTEKRALEVLDETQDFIEKQCMKHISSSGMYYEKYVVYQMPEE